jgi:hypothetical protein
MPFIEAVWILTPYGELKQREQLHTCCMQKFENLCFFINCLSSLVAHMLICFYFNKCEPMLVLQSMSYLCSNMHFWTRRYIHRKYSLNDL